LGDIIVGCGFFNGRFLNHQLSKVRAAELAEIFGLEVARVEGEAED
jgi:hypothetical protein